MSISVDRSRIRQALEQARNSWLFEYSGDQIDSVLDGMSHGVEEFVTEYQRRFGEAPDPFALLEQNPLKGTAFFQVDTLRASVEMKIMVWRIFLGAEIKRLELRYDDAGDFHLLVSIKSPFGEQENYESSYSWDFALLRHLGATSVNGRMVLQGYYAMRTGST
jgi:hypothetical protein